MPNQYFVVDEWNTAPDAVKQMARHIGEKWIVGYDPAGEIPEELATVSLTPVKIDWDNPMTISPNTPTRLTIPPSRIPPGVSFSATRDVDEMWVYQFAQPITLGTQPTIHVTGKAKGGKKSKGKKTTKSEIAEKGEKSEKGDKSDQSEKSEIQEKGEMNIRESPKITPLPINLPPPNPHASPLPASKVLTPIGVPKEESALVSSEKNLPETDPTTEEQELAELEQAIARKKALLAKKKQTATQERAKELEEQRKKLLAEINKLDKVLSKEDDKSESQ